MSTIKITAKELKGIIKLCNLLGKHNIRTKSIAVAVALENGVVDFYPFIENANVVIHTKAVPESWKNEFSFNLSILDELTFASEEVELTRTDRFLKVVNGSLKADLMALVQKPSFLQVKQVENANTFDIPPKIMETVVSYLTIPYSYIRSQKSHATIWLHSENGKFCATSTDSFSIGEIETEIPTEIDIKVHQYLLEALYSTQAEKAKIMVDGYSCYLSNGAAVIGVAGLSGQKQSMDSVYKKQKWEAGCNIEGKQLHAAAKQIISSLSAKDKLNSYISMTFEKDKVFFSLNHKTLGNINIEKINSSSNIEVYNQKSFVVHLHPQAFYDYTNMLNEKKMDMQVKVNSNAIYFETIVNECKIKYLFPTVQL